jgi:heat shock protein HtpX
MSRFGNQLRTVLLWRAHRAALWAVGGAMAPGYMPIMLALAVAMNVGAYFFSTPRCTHVRRARRSAGRAAELETMVRELRGPRGDPDAAGSSSMDDPPPNRVRDGPEPRTASSRSRAILRSCGPRAPWRAGPRARAHQERDIWSRTIAACLAVRSLSGHAFGFIGLGVRATRTASITPPWRPGDNAVAPTRRHAHPVGISRSREYLADDTGCASRGDPLSLATQRWPAGSCGVAPYRRGGRAAADRSLTS